MAINRHKENRESSFISQDIVNEGCRNDYLFRMAGFLQQKGFSDVAIKECIKKENEVKCQPPLEIQEIERIIQSTLKYKKGIVQLRNEIEYEKSFTLTQLYASKDDDEDDIVENMISVGLTLLGAPQKSGKTFFGLQLCDAIVEGKNFLGRKVQKGTAVYLAFEDKKTKIKKVKATKKALTVTWNKVSGVKGYQVQVATDKKFKKNKKTATVKKQKTTKVTIKKLKAKKKYYVRIRTYKTVNGKKVYSSWSKVKTVKTK